MLLRGYFGRDVLAQGNTVPVLAYSKAAERYNKKYNDNKQINDEYRNKIYSQEHVKTEPV